MCVYIIYIYIHPHICSTSILMYKVGIQRNKERAIGKTFPWDPMGMADSGTGSGPRKKCHKTKM